MLRANECSAANRKGDCLQDIIFPLRGVGVASSPSGIQGFDSEVNSTETFLFKQLRCNFNK